MSIKRIMFCMVLGSMIFFGACQLENQQKELINAEEGISTIIEKDNPGVDEILDLTDVANDNRKAIIIYSLKPVSFDAVLVKENIQVNQETHTSTVLGVERENMHCHRFNYTIIEPGDKIESVAYITEDSSDEKFINHLNGKISEVNAKEYTPQNADRSYSGSSLAWDRNWIWNYTRLYNYSGSDVQFCRALGK